MNTASLEQILSDLHMATGMDATIIDRSFRVLARRHSGLDFCNRIHTSAKCLELCVASDNEQLARVDRTGCVVCYTCPFGIYEAIAPIRKSGKIIAYLFLSMGLPESPGSQEVPAKQALRICPELKQSSLEQALQGVPSCPAEKMRAYCGLLALAADHIENNDLLSGPEQSLGQLAKNYIKSNLDQKITLAELSYRLGCSTVTLTTRFKEEFGQTVMEYILSKRMALARQLLPDGALSVEAVALRCGFQDPAYFSKCFKKQVGLSPLEWKKQQMPRSPATLPYKSEP